MPIGEQIRSRTVVVDPNVSEAEGSEGLCLITRTTAKVQHVAATLKPFTDHSQQFSRIPPGYSYSSQRFGSSRGDRIEPSSCIKWHLKLV